MKIKEDLMLRNIVGEWIIVPMGERLLEFNGMVKVNDSGAFIWKLLARDITKEEIVSAMLDEYDIDRAAAILEVETFIQTLTDANMLERTDN